MFKIAQIQIEKPFEALAAALKTQIIDGALPHGAMLNERDLVERSGLSRGSVREALRVLETQGLVETRRGRNGGRMVIRSSIAPVMDSLETYIRNGDPSLRSVSEAVELFEPGMAALAARNRTDADIEAMTAAVAALAETEDRAAFVARNADWHRAMSRATHNPILDAIHAAIGSALLDPRLNGFATETVRAAVVHAAERILAAIIEGDDMLAARRMNKHVRAYFRLLDGRR